MNSFNSEFVFGHDIEENWNRYYEEKFYLDKASYKNEASKDNLLTM